MDIKEEVKRGVSIYELPLVVCYYARVSTEHELQVTSIVNQIDYFEKYITSISNWKLVDGYVDEGISAKDVRKRENFIRMISDAREGKFNLILTKSVSRFARNTIDSIYYTNLLLDWGIGVLFVNDNINTFNNDSEFRLTLMASIAQDELRKLSESVKFGLQQSIARGVVLGNNNILGYVKNNGKLKIVLDEAIIVRDIFSLFATNRYKYSEVGRIIYQKYKKRLDSTGIKRILTNCKYRGYYCGKKSEVLNYKYQKRRTIEKKDWISYRDYESVPPIIDDKLWFKVQSVINKRNLIRKRQKEDDIYYGKLKCTLHKRSLTLKRKVYKEKTYFYYVCSGCVSISMTILDRIFYRKNLKEALVLPGEVLVIKIRCQ